MAKIMIIANTEKYPLQYPVWSRKAGSVAELKPEPKKGRAYEIVALALLKDEEWKSFSGDLFADREYITEYNSLLKAADYIGRPDGIQNCLLITNDGGESGVLIDSQGYDYARYSCIF